MPFYHLQLKAIKSNHHSNPIELKTLGDHIRKRRFELGVLQRDVAKKLDVTTSTVVNWERNHTEPEVQFYPAIFEFLGYNPMVKETSFPDKLSNHRKAKGYSRKRFASVLGIDEGTLKRWEDGRGKPGSKKLLQLVENLFSDACNDGGSLESD